MDIVKYDNGTYGLQKDTVKTIVDIEREIKKLKELQDNYKTKLLEQMNEGQIIKIDMPELTITRVEETTKETFDSKPFREEHSDLYDEYVKIGVVKPSLRIKVKEVVEEKEKLEKIKEILDNE